MIRLLYFSPSAFLILEFYKKLFLFQILKSNVSVLHQFSSEDRCFNMLMEACEAASDVLLQRPWLPVNISGCQLLAKSSFGEVTYHLLLTDTHCVWEEHAAPSHIQQRAQV